MKTRLSIITAVAACLTVLCQVSIWTTTRPSFPISSRSTIDLVDANLESELTAPVVVDMTFEKDTATGKDSRAIRQFPNFAPGVTRIIDLNADDGTRERLSEREWQDQLRDWLLMVVVADSGLSAYDIGGALFDLPPLRYGYLKASGQFDYGTSRSCYIGNGKVVGMLPADVSSAARDDAIAEIVDRHRKDQAGEIEIVELFEYRLLSDGLTAEITRTASLDVATYLDRNKGYHEATVATLYDLRRFLERIDDLTYAEITPEGLVLGGRKIQSYEFRGVGLQEVAAIWQSEQDIVRKELDFQRLIAIEKAAYGARWNSRIVSSNSEKFLLEAQAAQEWQQIERKLQEKARELRIVDGSGFSLDPTYDFAGLGNFFAALLDDPEKVVGNIFFYLGNLSAADAILSELQNMRPLIEEIASGIAKENILPLVELIDKLINSGDPNKELCASFLSDTSDSFRFQAARYNGKLQGTEAGMVLFYTDLLAKIWAIDYLDSAPVDKIKEFVSHTQIRLASIYDRESRELSKARLWFGPTDRGFQIAQESKQLFFQRISTRVYSKGHNPLDPANEVQTSAFLAAPIDWWDDHYAEVARYEPEYLRLNEVMKWSLLIGFLNEGENGALLNFLDDVIVDRSNWFPAWAKKNKTLKFDLWDQIKFYDKGYNGTSTEAMEYLWGKLTAGGVSLAPKRLFRNRAQIAPKLSKLNRRSNINYSSVRSGAGGFKTLDGVAVKLQRRGPTKVSVQSTPDPKLRLRATDSDLINAPFRRTITKTNNGLKTQAEAGGTNIGVLNIAKSANGFKVGWRARDIDAGQTLALRASRSADPEAVFADDPAVAQIFKMPTPETYAVKLRSSDKWMVLSRGGGGDSTVGGGWQSRVADPKKGGRSFQIKWVDKGAVEQQVRQAEWMALHPSRDGRLVIADIQSRGPPAEGITNVQFIAGDRSIAGTVDRSSGRVYIPAKKLPEAVSERIVDFPRRFGADQFRKARDATASAQQNTSIRIGNPEPLVEILQAGQFRRAAAEIVADPAKASQALDQALSKDFNAVSEFLRQGETGSALSQLARIKQLYGPQPEIRLWEGLVELSRGRSLQAAQTLGKATPGRIRNPRAFFDEIHARLNDSRTGRQARESLKNIESFAQWQRMGGGTAGSHGYAVPNIDNGRLAFEFHFIDPLGQGRVLSLSEAKQVGESGAPVYRQNSPRLNNLDWNVSQRRAFAQAIEMDLGKVVELPLGDIASLNPTKITAPTVSAHEESAGRLSEYYRTSLRNMERASNPARARGSNGGPDEEDDDKGDEEEDARNPMTRPLNDRIYLLMEKPMDG